ncbi:redoxin domain-containing protein [Candidatus Poribacteria bacterium]|nr:redoxin domain-containing protein [Candidatus Poribacteria bacterium]MYB63333.1 redoxin domain-containing protein [Candidatus Poribacteria bacterium]MYF54274.1 redoxin domain-containing protein [Candidatus Poribacteria bacterium]MYI94681.1 redoxin domain-containing protein [Candidatus Poribacteria bacterium]
MKHLHPYLVLTLLVITAFGCGSTEDPDSVIEVPVDETGVPSGTIQGEVQVIDGVSIQVRLLKEGQLISQTVADGSFQFDNVAAGDYILQITAKGYETEERNVTLEDGKLSEISRIELTELVEPVSHLSGVLTESETGNPLSGVLVKLMAKSGEIYEAMTSQLGVYTFENLPVNVPFTMNVLHYGFEKQNLEVNAISPDQTAELDAELIAIPDTVVLGPSEGLGVGSKAPDFELPDSNNQTHSLSQTLTSKNIVIVFYRGGW